MRCFGHDHQVFWKYGMIWCRNWYVCDIAQIMNFMCRTKHLIKNLKFEAWMHKLKFTCWIMKKHVSIQNEIIFMIFWWKSQMQARVGLSISWKVRWRKYFSSLKKCALSRNGKCRVSKHEIVSHLKIFGLNMKTFQKWC